MSLLNIGMSGLNAAQGSLSVLSNNIANVNTPGYSRQQTTQNASASNAFGGVFIGTGTTLADVRRVYNDFLNTAYQNSTALNSDANAYLGQASAIDKTLSDKSTGMSAVLSAFFAAAQTAAATPSDVSARQLLVTSAQTLSNRFNAISSQLTQQKESINGQLSTMSDQVNKLTSSIASLNKQISQVQGSTSNAPANLLDARNEAVRSLNELIGVTATEKDGQVNITTGTGQSLVDGDVANTISAVPSKNDSSQYTIQINMGSTSMDIGSVVSGGSIGGLMRYRSDVLMPAINDLGRLAIVTADTINNQLGQGLDLNGDFGSSLFSDINSAAAISQRSQGTAGNSAGSGNLNVSIADSSKLTTYDYKVTFTSGNQYNVVRSDGKAMGSFDTTTTPPPVIDGFTLALDGKGPMAAGDSFKVSPTSNGASGIGVDLTDPNKLAFAGPLAGVAGKNTGTGTFTPPQLTVPLDIHGGADTAQLRTGIENSMPVKMVFGDKAADGTQPYTVTDAQGFKIGTGSIIPGQGNKITINVPMRDASGAVITGKSFSFDTTVGGSPANNDSTTFSFNSGATSDGRNAQSLLALQTKATVGVTDGNGGVSLVSANSRLVSQVGSKAAQANTDSTATGALLTANKAAANSVSQVNLDEEAGDMIKFQQYYTASSQIIKAAQETFSTLINAL
ncbi:flagellar hook-associated protein FlgK [Pseudomonas sp. CBSPBW29]|uniref:flagellar hook-associated protein FlgK n=1 Tax=Pseudomonas TaxID=286 RepID=UPI0021ACD109|nr:MULTISPECIES: flagellar hook-associated protein FlgK [unclassified Pseudomonas]WEL42114.1 flagellar hook-associated protein FlgK [Pseudomonas sp. CBSPBW29]WEL63176.1 flagellar hook-associated protein FlgK [Pseudomonas sp. CBSPGW29]WEL72361.1 flagellar hook-associated protein FlgK [Pseudomonas sp. CBSPCGW29]WEL79259.1 flagellar hook-associated protein FlgK [Pseudomonas sp. CBSPAW29]WEL82083.1 flagellar hook-associated protein FlgK [Pseudomonas sp. CBSPCAW29]WEL90563.1 flagellar hook-associa